MNPEISDNPLILAHKQTTEYFQAGGALGLDHFYIPRQADQKIIQALSNGYFCYLLAPPQSGKSSLSIRTASQLEKRKIRCLHTSLATFSGLQATPETFFYSFANEILSEFDYSLEHRKFWESLQNTTPTQKWIQFLTKHLAKHLTSPLVIFVDEINLARQLPFVDDIFAAFAAIQEYYAKHPNKNFIAFCVLGVASPVTLQSDLERPLFAGGCRITLSDFVLDDVKSAVSPLLKGNAKQKEAQLREIFAWTSGYPYMMQHLLIGLSKATITPRTKIDSLVGQLVDEMFFRRCFHEDAPPDPTIIYAENCFRKERKDVDVQAMLRLYRKIMEGEKIPFDEKDPTHLGLWLSGIVAPRGTDKEGLLLEQRNKIFARFFDQQWLQKTETEHLFGDELARWLHSNRDEHYLLRGKVLENARKLTKHRITLTPEETEFLAASEDISRRDQALRALEKKQELEKGIAQIEDYDKALTTSLRSTTPRNPEDILIGHEFALQGLSLSDVAESLDKLSSFYSGMGRKEDALRLSEEAVVIYRKLAEKNDKDSLSGLARSLSNLGVSYNDMGRAEDSLRVDEEAFVIYRKLAAKNESAFLPDLARSLSNLGVSYSNIGRFEAAHRVDEEAVVIYRKLAAKNDKDSLSGLARSLSNLGISYRDMGRAEDSLLLSKEAVVIYRKLAAKNEKAFLSDLAISLNNLGASYYNVGKRKDSLRVDEEAVIIHRNLAAKNEGAFLPGLARSLNNLGVSYRDMGRAEDSLRVDEEAVVIYRKLAEKNEGAFLPDLARSLNNLGTSYRDTGRREDALRVDKESVVIHRNLAAKNEGAFLPDLASSLHNLEISYSDLGRTEDARRVAEELATIQSRLGAKPPRRKPLWTVKRPQPP